MAGRRMAMVRQGTGSAATVPWTLAHRLPLAPACVSPEPHLAHIIL